MSNNSLDKKYQKIFIKIGKNIKTHRKKTEPIAKRI